MSVTSASRKSARKPARPPAPQAALGADQVLPALGEQFPGHGRRVVGWEARTVADSSSRPVYRYAVRWVTASGETREAVVIGKGYNRGDGAAVYRLMREMEQAGAASGRPLSMPRALGYVPSPPLLLQTVAPPHTLYDGIDQPQAGLRWVRDSGRWLADLHAVEGVSAPTWALADEQVKLQEYAAGLAGAAPHLARSLERVVDHTLAAIAGERRVRPVLTHGDYQPKNIHVGVDGVEVIDFDRCALAHPARDLGHFVGQSMTMSYVRTGGFTAIGPWLAAFLDGYREAAGPTAEEGLLPYLVRTYLEILFYRLVVKPVADPSFAQPWLAECERWLADGRLVLGPEVRLAS